MTKYFKTNNVIVRRFEMKDVKQAYQNLSEENNVIDSDKDSGKLDNVKNESIKFKGIENTKVIIKSAINEFYTDEPIWAVEDKKNKNLVGGIRVSNYSPKNRMCNISWRMSYKYCNDKFMKEALIQIFKFLFTKKSIELVECSFFEQSQRNSLILEEIGMKKEARLRDRRINEKTNKKENFVIYSINKQEFFDLLSQNKNMKSKVCKYMRIKV